MIALKAHFDGRVIVPDEPLDLPANQRLEVRVEPVDSPKAPAGPRQFGMQPEAVVWIAPDFDDELPDEFWLGEEP